MNIWESIFLRDTNVIYNANSETGYRLAAGHFKTPITPKITIFKLLSTDIRE
jgi:hypothetical protein